MLNAEMENARLQKRLCDSTEREIKQALGYCMVLVGIRSENLLSEKETLIIINFLSRHFPYTTPEDIILAFEFAIAGKLDLSQSDINSYQNFTCLYVATILRAYKKYFNERMAQPKRIEMKALPPANFNPIELVDMHYQEFLVGSLNINTISTRVIQIAAEKCGLLVYENEYIQYLKKAKIELNALKKIGEIISESDIEKRAIGLCLQDWFGQQKEAGILKIEAKKI